MHEPFKGRPSDALHIRSWCVLATLSDLSLPSLSINLPCAPERKAGRVFRSPVRRKVSRISPWLTKFTSRCMYECSYCQTCRSSILLGRHPTAFVLGELGSQ